MKTILLSALLLLPALRAPAEEPKPVPDNKAEKDEAALDAAELATLAEGASPYSKFAASLIREMKKQNVAFGKDEAFHVKNDDSEETWKIGPDSDEKQPSLFLHIEVKMHAKGVFAGDTRSQMEGLGQIFDEMFKGPLEKKELAAIHKSMTDAMNSLRSATFRITGTSDWIPGEGLRFQCTLAQANSAAQSWPYWIVEARWLKPM